MKIFKSIILIILSVLASSCVEYKELIKLNNDGSGSVSIKIGVDGKFDAMMLALDKKDTRDLAEKMLPSEEIKLWVKDKSGVKIIKESLYQDHGLHWKKVVLSFERINSLVLLANGLPESKNSKNNPFKFIGNISFEEVNGKIIYKRNIVKSQEDRKPNPLFSKKDIDDMLKEIAASHTVSYSIDLPMKVEESNATSTEIDPDNKEHTKLTWKYSLYEMTQADHEMNATIKHWD